MIPQYIVSRAGDNRGVLEEFQDDGTYKPVVGHEALIRVATRGNAGYYEETAGVEKCGTNEELRDAPLVEVPTNVYGTVRIGPRPIYQCMWCLAVYRHLDDRTVPDCPNPHKDSPQMVVGYGK